MSKQLYPNGSSFRHPEAFALMWYACTCGHRERFWNSRDGVTPFGGILCSSCGEGDLRHVDWSADTCKPDHKLVVGQRFFRAGTAIDAVRIIERRIKHQNVMGAPIPDDIKAVMLHDAREQTGEWHEGWPMVDRRGEDNA